jgi:hypothetical protein
MKYVLCKFRAEDARSYTYLRDGHEIAVGDQAKVTDKSGDGWKRVQVVGFTDVDPSFECKPILGRYDPDTEILAAIEAGTTEPTRKPDALSAPVVEF